MMKYDGSANIKTLSSTYLRVLVELGIIGFTIWISFWLWVVNKLRLAAQQKFITTKGIDYYSHSLIVCIICIFISWIATDTLNFFNQFIILGLALERISKGYLDTKIKVT